MRESPELRTQIGVESFNRLNEADRGHLQIFGKLHVILRASRIRHGGNHPCVRQVTANQLLSRSHIVFIVPTLPQFPLR